MKKKHGKNNKNKKYLNKIEYKYKKKIKLKLIK